VVATNQAEASTLVDQKYCCGCAKVIHKGARACPACGAPQGNYRASGGKSRGLAILLALFLGGIGIHKFYLGSPGWGILYMLFFWTFIPALIALLEVIGYLIMGEERFHATYG
jgi:TM2 domain-containing membrane protein YozV